MFLHIRLSILAPIFLVAIALVSASPADLDIDDDSVRIIYSDVPMNNLVRSCFKSIPLKYRHSCLIDSFEAYAGSRLPNRSRCCTKWAQISCLEKYAYNSLYCNLHQRTAVSRFFELVRSLRAEGSPECHTFRPVEEEKQLWSSTLGRVAKCSEAPNREVI